MKNHVAGAIHASSHFYWPSFSENRFFIRTESVNNLCSPKSDNTSLALLELYESDGEEETRRNAREVSWESHDTKLSQVHQARDIRIN